MDEPSTLRSGWCCWIRRDSSRLVLLAGIAVSEETREFLLTDDASQYFRLLEVKTVRGVGQQMFANFRTLVKFVFIDSGY